MSLREALIAQLARYDDDAYAALANRGLLRRARKDLEKEPPSIVEEGATRLVLAVGAHRVEFDVRGPAAARCSCPAHATCQHILAAALTLAALASAPGMSAADSPSEEDIRSRLSQALLDFSPEILRRYAGSAGYRWAWQFARDLDLERDLTVGGEKHIVVGFRHPPLTFRYLGGAVEELLPDHDIKQIEKYRVAAILAYQRAQGRGPEAPEDTAPVTAALNLGKDHAPDESGNATLSSQRVRLLTAVRQLARECVTLGIAHCSSGIQERFATLAVWAQGAQLYRLALMLRRIADHVEMLLERAGGADEQRLFQELTLAYALASSLETALERGKTPAALIGRARTEYEEVGQLELLGLGASAWRSPSGYVGLTMMFYCPAQQVFYSCTDARPEIQRGFDPVARYKAAGPWSGLGAPALATGRKLVLTGALVSATGRLSASDKTHATLTAMDAGVFLANLRPHTRWLAIAEQRAARRRSLLAEPRPLEDWVLLRPKVFGRPEFDAARQTLILPLKDEDDELLMAEVPYDAYTAPVIGRLELVDTNREWLMVAHLRGGSSRFVAEPLSLLDPHSKGSASPVDSLYFDAAPTGGVMSRILATLRRRPEAALVPPLQVSSSPPLLTEMCGFLRLRAERGLAGDSAAATRKELRQRLARLAAAGFSAFGAGVAPDAATELLRAHYLCMQYEHLMDDSTEPSG